MGLEEMAIQLSGGVGVLISEPGDGMVGLLKNVGIGGGFGITKLGIWGGLNFLYGGAVTVCGGCGCSITGPEGAGAGGKCLVFGEGSVFDFGTGGYEGLLTVGVDGGGRILDFGIGGRVVGGGNGSFFFFCGGIGGV